MLSLITGAALLAHLSPSHGAEAQPAPEVSSQMLAVADGALLPIYLSRDWSRPLPDIERAVILQHGVARNASVYFKIALDTQAAAGASSARTLMMAPHFLDARDAETSHLPQSVLRYRAQGWEEGDRAIGPKPISSFAALDAILARLADKHMFPNLKEVVVAGHSGGAQMVQRYAILGKEGDILRGTGVGVRYVVANPSSYAYFGPDRPEPAIAAACPGFDDWKYGMRNLPAYAAAKSPAHYEADYVARQVIYLLGARDTNPDHPALDRTCMAEAQGPDRWARGHAYIAHMKARDNGTPNHRLHEIPGVAHNARRMFTSACGLSALFDIAGCE